ncbi:mechanosensitive ion channel family protein [Flavobacterium ardleyense]|uniref:Mechanosensitive ion channel family protein n=1 Tax=Flavobacterium ardleyense TaxID=2038737 RepID=A0ABW5Z6M7_9FLAO
MEKIQKTFSEIIASIQHNIIPLLTGFAVLFIGFYISGKLKDFIRNTVLSKSPNALRRVFISQIVGISVQLFTIVFALRVFGYRDLTTSLLAGAGVLTFVIGFAFKDIGENFLAGILLAFKSPFRINDLIETSGIIGYVVDLSIRDTRIKTLDGKDVFVPNGQIIKNPLFNYTLDGFLRYEFVIGLDYDSNIHNAIDVILEAVKTVEGVIHSHKIPTVTIDTFASSTINLKVMFWLDTFESTSKTYHSGIRTEVMKRVLDSLTSGGFNLPSDIIEIKQYNAKL